jgi:hypothetical protein
VGSSGNRNLLLTGLFGAVKVIACSFFIWFLAERFGRRSLLTRGSALMAICMLITALIVNFIPTESSNGSHVTSTGKATVAMIYLDIMVSLWDTITAAVAATMIIQKTETDFPYLDLQLLLGASPMGLRP